MHIFKKIPGFKRLSLLLSAMLSSLGLVAQAEAHRYSEADIAKYREKHGTLTVTMIDTTSTEELAHLVFQHIAWKSYDWKNQKSRPLSVHSPEELVIYHTYELDMKVQNGGFSQYFHNREDVRNQKLLECFNAIKAYQAADFIGKLLEMRDDPSFNAAAMTFEKENSTWYNLIQKENILELQAAYIRVNKHKFAQ